MKLSVTQSNLNKALTTVSRIVGARSSLPILANVLFNTDSARLKISATNLEMGITYHIGCKVEEDGSATVPARLISELVSSLPDDKIQLVSENDNLAVKTTNVASLVNGQSPDEFPEVPRVSTKSKVKLPSSELLHLLSQVMISASNDEARPVLAGIYMASEGGELILAATDSYRLSEVRVKSDLKINSPIILPIRAAAEVTRIAGGYSGDVEIMIGKTEVMFVFGDIELVSRLIDGKFPSYGQIIPTKHSTGIVIDREELSHAVKVANLFAREGANTIRLEIKNGKLTILSSATQVGENTSTIAVKSQGADGEISLNARFLSDVLSSIDSKMVAIKINSKLDPCLIVPEASTTKEKLLHIIMPLRS